MKAVDMTDVTDLHQIALESLRKRITQFLPGQIRKSIDELTDEQLWWRPNDESNLG